MLSPSRSLASLKRYTCNLFRPQQLIVLGQASQQHVQAISPQSILIDTRPPEQRGGWHAARQFVAVETQIGELAQEPELGWKGTSQFVVEEKQTL